MERENRPLKGIVVACFSPSTPYSAVIVASQLQMVGATVTLILPSMENPSMAQDRSGLGGLTDRLKVIHLNLKTPQGRQEACTLCGACDVVVEGFRPGVAARLGLLPNDETVWLSLPGFAPEDPQFRGVRAYEAVIASASGVLPLASDLLRTGFASA